MTSLTCKTAKLLQIIFCIILFIGCNSNHEKAVHESKNHCGEKGYLTVVIQYAAKADTLCMLPQEVITNKMVDSVSAEVAQRVDNYNPGFINMVLTPTDHLLVFSKENHYDISVMERWTDDKYNFGFETHLRIDQMGRGAYHISYDPGNKPFEIQFTPTFASILQKLKNEK